MRKIATILMGLSLMACRPAALEFTTIQPAPVCPGPSIPVTPPLPVGPSTPTGPMVCLGYTQLVPISEVVVVPARDVYQTCYYIKLFDAVSSTPTSSNVVERPDVLSVNWDGNTPNPRVIGSTNSFAGATKSFSLVVQGLRNAKFSSDSQGLNQTTVDNFFLIQANNVAAGFGTQDCSPVGGMKVNGIPVINYTATISAGTATVPVTDISAMINTNTVTSFRASGLDCGGSSNVSSGYLVFE